MTVAGPALIARDFEEVNGIEAIIAKLNLRHGPTAGIGNPHRGADDAPFIQRRIPGRFQSLGGGKDTPKRWTDILPEDIGNAEMFFPVMKGHANRLNQSCHNTSR